MRSLFIPSQFGRLFCNFYSSSGKKGHAILHIPAFAEEMNKSRRMVALQAQAFSEQGHDVLVLDLYGTGDSIGDFSEATWQIWQENIGTAIGWLNAQGSQTVSLWGLRLGALLAMAFANYSASPIERLIAWHPVHNGDVYVTQFLRLRVAAAIMDNNAPPEKTSELKQRLLAGQPVEVAGYLLNPQLIAPLLSLRAEKLNLQSVKKLALFEMAATEDTPHTIGNTQFLNALQQQNIPATLQKVVGNAFWASQEISEAPGLISASCLETRQAD